MKNIHDILTFKGGVDVLFKGYVLTQDKKCIEKFKGRTDFKTLNQVKTLPEYAGILAEKTILIDVDDFDQSEILFEIVKDKGLKCRVYQTTRGKHFLFNNPDLVNSNRTKATLAIGIEADIKIGKRNSYSILKFNNVDRPILYDATENEQAADVPKWLLPIKTNADFITMNEGDGRNQALFNYILTLQSNDFSVDEARETIHLINRYVLKEPLSESELDVILRDDAFGKPVFFKGNTFLFDKFAVFLKNNHHICRVNNQLHIYKDGIYVAEQAEIEAAMISHLPQLNKAKRSEVLAYLDVLIRNNTPVAPAHLVAFRNGLYNVLDGSFSNFTHEQVITNKIHWDYNATAYWQQTDEMLNNIACVDPAIRSLLEEMIGYCLFRRNELGKAFILTGSGSNGKSTFLNLVKRMLGTQNISVLDVKDLGDKFSTVMMLNKLANIGDDISDEFLADTSKFKKIVTGEMIDAQQKGQPKFQFEPYVKLIFSANEIPRIGKGKDSGAILRRLVIVPFNAKFDNKNPDFKPFIFDTLKSQESMEYLIQLGVKGLKRVLENRNFTTSEKVEIELNEYEEMNNPILGFFKECEVDDFNIENEITSNVYRKYQEYCINNSLTPLSHCGFSRQVKKHFDFVIIDKKLQGKKYRIFVKG